MTSEIDFWAAVKEIRSHDASYAPEFYGFIMDALEFTMSQLGERRHISAQELLTCLCAFAKEKYGLLGFSILHKWGVATTDDVGRAVFQLVDANVLARQESDQLADFNDVFDLRHALEDSYFEST